MTIAIVLASVLVAFILVRRTVGGSFGRGRKGAPVVVVSSGEGRTIVGAPLVASVSPGHGKMPKAQRRRRAAGIAAYVGFNGSSKSALAVSDCLVDLAQGVHVLSTLAFLADEPAGSVEAATAAWDALGVGPDARPLDPMRLPHPLWIPFTDFRQLIEAKDLVVLMDEVQGIADAREHASLPPQVSNLLFQLRRKGCILRWTTIDYDAADKRIRRATQIVTLCKGFAPHYIDGSVWPRNRWFYARTYSGQGFDSFNTAHQRQDKHRRPKRLAWQIYTGRRWLQPAFMHFDSMASVTTVGAVSDLGMCLDCGGKRSARRCSCHSETVPRERVRRSRPQRSEDAQAVLAEAPAASAGGAGAPPAPLDPPSVEPGQIEAA